MWAVPPQPCSQSRKRRWFDWSAVCSACQGAENAEGVTGQPYAVLFSTVCCTDPTVLVCGNGHWFSCPTAAPCGPFGAQPSASGNLIASRQAHFSTITRLPSGSSISHSALFRDPALSVGVGTAHPCTGALAALCRIPAPPEPFLSV